MGDIFDASGSRVAKIESDSSGLIVRDGSTVYGKVHGDQVWNEHEKVGHFDSSGNVFNGSTRVGIVESSGIVKGNSGYAGKVTGSYMKEGGAALLLLIGK